MSQPMFAALPHHPFVHSLSPDSPADEVARYLTTSGTERISGDCANWPNVREGFQWGVSQSIASTPSFPEPEMQRGITIVGGGKYLACAYVTVRVLRHVGCNLPIDVWHFEGENDPSIEAALRPYDVTFQNADRLDQQTPFRFLRGHWWQGWQLKAFALMHSRFESTLLLDADNYPVRDPEYLFDWPTFESRGAVFWPDQENSPTKIDSRVCRLFEIQPPSELTTESGQLLVNRRHCWPQLNLASFYNQAADVTYRYIWGDKDTFPIAFDRTKKEYGRMWPVCQLVPDAILQFDHLGRVVFQHRVGDKFRLADDAYHSTPQRSGSNHYNDALAHESFCFAALEELRQLIRQ